MKQLIFTAFDNGITHFDLANNYGPVYGSAETNFGRILREELGAYRDELIITTKAGYDMCPGPYGDHGSRKYLLASLDQSLERLGLDYVDIFYHHRMDPETPLEETMGALAQAVYSGKALYIGLSRYDVPTMIRAEKILRDLKVPYIINQDRYNLLNRDIEFNGVMETSMELGKGMIIFSPLAQGVLSGKYNTGIPKDSRIRTDGRYLKESSLDIAVLEKVKALAAIAEKRNQSLTKMALAYVASKPAVTSVLIGASRPSQILENITMLDNTSFSVSELEEINRITGVSD
jgi:L-glyceraldehyde 3-phosphate reductase